MIKLPMTLAAVAALLCGTAAMSQTAPAPAPAKPSMWKKMTSAVKPKATPVATVTPVAKPVPVAKQPVAAPAPAAVAKAAPKPRVVKATTTGRMVQAKLSNGKTVTYNCSLKGNLNKKACQ